MICPIEGRSLDDQQLACILKETRNHIVVAGAGTGKTITVIAKIKFLLKANKFKPNEILVLSFTNASATEMCQRIRKETGVSIDAMTFHKLGMTIITAVNGVKPNITQISLSAFIRQALNELIKNPLYLKKFITYLYFHRTKQKSEFEFTTQTEYNDYLELNQPITMKNEIVKSYGEMDIANYLYKNGINYQYEVPYKINTATEEYARYVPDFYLPDEDIYIEYFGINRNGKVPSYFTGKNNKTASQTYKESMIWKRMLHTENNTVMLELYGYDMLEGQLLQELEEKLKAENVSFKPKSDSELWVEIKTTHKSIFESLGRLFETVINLVKINDYPFEKVYALNKVHKGNQYQNNRSVLELIEPIFNRYAAELNKNSEIDFNDMINLASKYVADGKYQHPYGYVIVDEYQDISKARYNLLKHMRDKNDYGLFCVGDDWQSIYGFAGSDLNYILDFDRYWGVSEKSKIETTYRFSPSLIQVSGEFVMKNPKQIKKKLRAANEALTVSAHGSNHANEFSLGLIEGYTAKNTVTFMENTITDLPQNSSVFFIGRYNNDVKIFENSPFKCHYEKVMGKTIGVCQDSCHHFTTFSLYILQTYAVEISIKSCSSVFTGLRKTLTSSSHFRHCRDQRFGFFSLACS
ncbi:UvrD-helicase domain-containing protein [Acetobacterium bakii]